MFLRAFSPSEAARRARWLNEAKAGVASEFAAGGLPLGSPKAGPKTGRVIVEGHGQGEGADR